MNPDPKLPTLQVSCRALQGRLPQGQWWLIPTLVLCGLGGDPEANVTPLGHFAFFVEYSKSGWRFDALVADGEAKVAGGGPRVSARDGYGRARSGSKFAMFAADADHTWQLCAAIRQALRTKVPGLFSDHQ